MCVETRIFSGGCDHLRYRMTETPLIVHGCHCRLCQRQTGASFAVNALVEADRIEITAGSFTEIVVPTPSGRGQTISRCSVCQIALWSVYHRFGDGIGDLVRFVRVGTLDEPGLLPPQVHIYTATKQPHVCLPGEVPAFGGFYPLRKVWSPGSLRRLAALVAALDVPMREVTVQGR